MLDVVKNGRILAHPPIEPLLRGIIRRVYLNEGQQLLEQSVARLFERPHGALEALEELCADQPYQLALPVLLDRIDGGVGTDVIRQRVVQRQAE
jgi:hypothetical protein